MKAILIAAALFVAADPAAEPPVPKPQSITPADLCKVVAMHWCNQRYPARFTPDGVYNVSSYGQPEGDGVLTWYGSYVLRYDSGVPTLECVEHSHLATADNNQPNAVPVRRSYVLRREGKYLVCTDYGMKLELPEGGKK